ncbi:hypothetical protein [Niveibacterium umoris]|uniref:Uncharacterized protein n=1 Tax=Niveibacterium umoris TaxID=1193620 RepID=A0A840BIA3_9RHOO|nr:hypothetical protein [Niveibacterium umoris]MBB4013281.1 hypothetical protein [Niveibacterium umoris]
MAGCATPEPPPPPAPEPPPAAAPAPISSVEPVAPAPKPAPAKPAKTKPKKGDKAGDKVAEKAAEKPADVAAVRSADAGEPVAPPEPVAKAEPEIRGPAWLSKCATKRFDGGAILCDADALLASPSGTIKVYTRDPNLAGPVASGGRIEYRPGLPRRYRLFVLP